MKKSMQGPLVSLSMSVHEALGYVVARAPFYLGEYFAHVFAYYAERYEYYASKEPYREHQRCPARHCVASEVRYEYPRRYHDVEQQQHQTEAEYEAHRLGRERGYAVDRQGEQLAEGVFGFSGGACAAVVGHGCPFKADGGHYAAYEEVALRVFFEDVEGAASHESEFGVVVYSFESEGVL